MMNTGRTLFPRTGLTRHEPVFNASQAVCQGACRKETRERAVSGTTPTRGRPAMDPPRGRARTAAKHRGPQSQAPTTVDGSTFTPGPIVEEMAMRWM